MLHKLKKSSKALTSLLKAEVDKGDNSSAGKERRLIRAKHNCNRKIEQIRKEKKKNKK